MTPIHDSIFKNMSKHSKLIPLHESVSLNIERYATKLNKPLRQFFSQLSAELIKIFWFARSDWVVLLFPRHILDIREHANGEY